MLYVQCESKRRHDKRVESGLGLGLGSLEWRWLRVINGVDDGSMILADHWLGYCLLPSAFFTSSFRFCRL